MVCETVSELANPLDRDGHLFAPPRRVGEGMANRLAPKFLVFGPEQARPEPEGQLRYDLVSAFFPLRPKALTGRSDGFRNMVPAGSREQEPRDSTLVLTKVMTKTSIERVPEQNFHMTDRLERGCRSPSAPFV
jgi:hypothetical protein